MFVSSQTVHRWNERIVAFMAFCFVTSVWQITYGVSYSMHTEAEALRWLKIGYSGVIFMPVTYLHFCASFVSKGKLKVPIQVCYVLSLIFLVTLHTDLFLDGTYRYFFGFYPKANSFVHPPFMLLMSASVLTSMYVLYKEWRKRVRDENYLIQNDTEIHQIKLVFFAFMFITISASDFLPNYGFEYYPIGVICVVSFSLVISYTILKYNLHDIQVIVKRTLVFAGLVGSVVAVVSLVAFVSQDLLIRYVAIPKWLSNVLSAAIIAGVYGPTRDWLTNSTDKYLFQKRYDYKDLLKKFTDEVMVMVDLSKLLDMTVTTLSEVVKLKNAQLLLMDTETRDYQMVAAEGIKLNAEYKLEEQEEMITFLRETHEPIGLDGKLGEVKYTDSIKERLKEIDAQVCLPLHVHEDLIGVLCLGTKKSDEEFTSDDLAVLVPLAKTLAIAISNAQLFDELVKTQAEAAQREKLAVIGTLSAGINHEICNPLGIMKVQLESFMLDHEDGLLEGKDKAEIMERVQSILQVSLKQIDRATAITQKLSNFAKPSKAPKVETVSVAEQVDEVLSLVGHDLKLEKIQVEKQIAEGLPEIVVDKRQLEEVLFNLIRNAGQAIVPPGTITVRAKQKDQRIVIEIADTGTGISEKGLKKIFDPFFTTKEPGKGTGLGLFIVRQIVERNKGRISVESTEGEGTTFFLDFPVASEAVVA